MIKGDKLTEISTYNINLNNTFYYVKMSVSKTGYKIEVYNNDDTIYDYNIIQEIETYIFDNFINNLITKN